MSHYPPQKQQGAYPPPNDQGYGQYPPPQAVQQQYGQPPPQSSGAQMYPPTAPGPMPHSGPAATVPDGDRLAPVTGMRDPWFIAVFIIHLLGVIALVVINGSKDDRPHDDGTRTDQTDVGSVITVLVGCACLAGAFGFLWMFLMHKIPKQLIWFGLIANVVILAVAAIYFAAKESYGPAVIFFIFALLSAVYAYLVRHRVPFSAALMSMSTAIIKQYPANFTVAFGGLFVQIVWIIFWAYATALTSRKEDMTWGMLYLLFSFYYTTQVIHGVVHVTICGCVGSWYYATGHHNPTLLSLKRATTTSFGSVCFGALVIAVIKWTRAMVRMAMNSSDNWALKCVCNCIFGMLERLAEIFNDTAGVYIAVYGHKFVQASKATWELIKTSGMSVLINESLTDTVLFFGALIGGCLTGLVSYPWATSLRDDGKIEPDAVAIVVVAAFVIGFVVVAVLISPIDSAITSIFVLFAEDPAQLRSVAPEFHATLEGTYRAKRQQQQGQQPAA